MSRRFLLVGSLRRWRNRLRARDIAPILTSWTTIIRGIGLWNEPMQFYDHGCGNNVWHTSCWHAHTIAAILTHITMAFPSPAIDGWACKEPSNLHINLQPLFFCRRLNGWNSRPLYVRQSSSILLWSVDAIWSRVVFKAVIFLPTSLYDLYGQHTRKPMAHGLVESK